MCKSLVKLRNHFVSLYDTRTLISNIIIKVTWAALKFGTNSNWNTTVRSHFFQTNK